MVAGHRGDKTPLFVNAETRGLRQFAYCFAVWTIIAFVRQRRAIVNTQRFCQWTSTLSICIVKVFSFPYLKCTEVKSRIVCQTLPHSVSTEINIIRLLQWLLLILLNYIHLWRKKSKKVCQNCTFVQKCPFLNFWKVQTGYFT